MFVLWKICHIYRLFSLVVGSNVGLQSWVFEAGTSTSCNYFILGYLGVLPKGLRLVQIKILIEPLTRAIILLAI